MNLFKNNAHDLHKRSYFDYKQPQFYTLTRGPVHTKSCTSNTLLLASAGHPTHHHL